MIKLREHNGTNDQHRSGENNQYRQLPSVSILRGRFEHTHIWSYQIGGKVLPGGG
jgi:hypothetical protein